MTGVKKCSVCKVFKGHELYGRNRSRKDGYHDSCKVCKAASDKKSHQKNRDKRIEKMSVYYQSNKEKLLADCKIYREENKARISEYKKGWHIRNKDAVNERSRIWRERNGAQNIEVKKKWYRTNRERVYSNVLKRKSQKHHVRFYGVKRKELLDRDNWQCQSCGKKVHDRNVGGNDNRHLWDDEFKAHIDHIIPISKGGDSVPENLQILCRTCNLSKKDQTDLEIEKTGQIKLAL